MCPVLLDIKSASFRLNIGQAPESDEAHGTSEKPVKQLKLIHAELDRQRTVLSARLSSMHTRAAILVTASGVFSTVQAASWLSGWQFISIALSVIAASLGLWAMRPAPGVDAFAGKSFEERLWADSYSTEMSIVEDSITGLKNDMELAADSGKIVAVGYLVLAAAWVAMPIMVVLVNTKLI